MPSIPEYLHQFARQAQVDTSGLQSELLQIEARKQEIERKLEAARLAAQRASSFISGSGLDLYCPRCWIFDGRPQSQLRSIPSDKRRVDLYRCNVCEYEYEVET